MPIIYSNVSNENFNVCCMGNTVYVYNHSGRELERFTLVKADFPVLSPKGDVFAVKSKDGCVAVYSFDKLSRVATLRFSDRETQLEKGMCFSGDGEKLFSIEGADSSDISVSDINSFSHIKTVKAGKQLTHIECSDDKIYVLGIDGEKNFVAVFDEEKLTDVKYIEAFDFEFYYNYKCAEARGFSSAAMDLYLPKLHNVEDNKTSLKELWDKTEVQ